MKWVRAVPTRRSCVVLPPQSVPPPSNPPAPFDLYCPLLEIRVGLSRRISHLQLADGQVIWPIGIPLKAVETDASGGVLMSLPIQSEMGGNGIPLVL